MKIYGHSSITIFFWCHQPNQLTNNHLPPIQLNSSISYLSLSLSKTEQYLYFSHRFSSSAHSFENHKKKEKAKKPKMARKKIREYDSKRLVKEHLKRLANIDLQIHSAQVPQPSTTFSIFL